MYLCNYILFNAFVLNNFQPIKGRPRPTDRPNMRSEVSLCGFRDMGADKRTNRQTDITLNRAEKLPPGFCARTVVVHNGDALLAYMMMPSC